MLVSAGLIAAALAVGGPLAANAAGTPSVTLNTTTATVGGSIQVTADGFQPNEALTFTVDSGKQGTQAADDTGHLESSVYVPQGTSVGTHSVHVTGEATAEQTVEFTVIASPIMTLSASTVTLSQLNGAGISATVTGFTPGELVQFGYGSGNSGSEFGDPIVADAQGSATIAVTSQALFGAATSTAGTIYVSAGNQAGNVWSTAATLQVVADASPSVPAAPAVPVKAAASFTG
jgi:hypothetical protein